MDHRTIHAYGTSGCQRERGDGVIYVVGGSISGGTIVTTNEAYLPPPMLANIVVTPANPLIGAGTNEQFTATGEFSDGSSRVLTTASWTEESPMPTAVSSSGRPR